ncbi:hypothetical protein, partial [Sinorhizobium medicae]|uniref:hypothetical protein n=1 Tax=Sinorhizobium medicae TaxID=110321 RepID=UPI000517FDC6
PIIRLIPCQITQRIESCVPSARNAEFFNSIGANLQFGGIYACPLLGYHHALLSVRLEGAFRTWLA